MLYSLFLPPPLSFPGLVLSCFSCWKFCFFVSNSLYPSLFCFFSSSSSSSHFSFFRISLFHCLFFSLCQSCWAHVVCLVVWVLDLLSAKAFSKITVYVWLLSKVFPLSLSLSPFIHSGCSQIDAHLRLEIFKHLDMNRETQLNPLSFIFKLFYFHFLWALIPRFCAVFLSRRSSK